MADIDVDEGLKKVLSKATMEFDLKSSINFCNEVVTM